MTNNGLRIVFVFFEKFLSARKSNLIDVFLNLGSRHTNSTVGNCKRTFLLIYRNAHSQVAQFTFKIANRSQCFQFLSCIYGVRH